MFNLTFNDNHTIEQKLFDLVIFELNAIFNDKEFMKNIIDDGLIEVLSGSIIYKIIYDEVLL